jgi:drug/metabolite transporter (DMT)-like permease
VCRSAEIKITTLRPSPFIASRRIPTVLSFPLYARLFGRGTRRGVASMVLGMAAFVTNDSLIKLASTSTPTGQLITLRNIMTTALLLLLLWATGQAAQMRRCVNPAVLTRSGIDVVATILYLVALFHMPIGNIMAINMGSPLLMTAVAAVFLGVPVGWRRWTAVAVGFGGILLIVQPRAEGFNAYALVALASTVFIVARDLTTRRVDQSIPSLVIALANSVFVLTGALALAAVEGWVTIGWREVLLLGGAGIFLVMGYLLIVDAFRHGDIATVGPFRYTGLIWALTAGYMIWGDIPNPLAWAGIVIVVASGLYVLHRERLKARDEAAKTVPVE